MPDPILAQLPNAERAIVEDAKLAGYLLDLAHHDGDSKARFFLAHGFRTDWPADLRAALIAHGQAHPVASVRSLPYGMRYAVVGPLTPPDGTTRSLRTVWQVDNGTDFPRLITAYPND